MPRQHSSFARPLLAGLIATTLTLTAAASARAQTPVTPPGSGTSTNPYQISELGHLAWMSNTAGGSAIRYYTMTADIDASPTAEWNDTGTGTDTLEGFKPIGMQSYFGGIFEGNGHTISGLVINRPTAAKVGLFSILGGGGQVRNLGLIHGTTTGSSYVGGLIGSNGNGTVSTCYTAGAVTGQTYVGGLVGENSSSTISNCFSTSAVTGSARVGGLIGYGYRGTVLNSYSAGAVSGSSLFGGLIGADSASTVSNSYWDVEASGQDTSAKGTGKTTAQMAQQTTFAGWDLATVWGIVEGASYPYLRSSPPPFRLSVRTSGPGSVIVEPESVDGTYEPGTLVTLTAIPNTAASGFAGWVNASPSDSPAIPLAMNGHRLVTAMFVPRIEINSLTDLARIGRDPAYPLTNVIYLLTSDIDASLTATWNDDGTGTDSLEGFIPIGTISAPFTGIFDGQGHTITGLVINRPTGNGVGLFGYVGPHGQVRDLILVDGTIAGWSGIGGLIGNSDFATVRNCTTTGTVTGSSMLGGLIGYNANTSRVSNCGSTCTATGTAGSVGGLIGGNYSSSVSNCYATGTTMGTGKGYGGLIGVNSGAISTSYATGNVTCPAAAYVGGLVGSNYGTAVNCFATGAVMGNSDVGGLIGTQDYGTTSTSFSTGRVIGQGSAGGLVGRAYPSATAPDSYWDTQISGLSTSAAGTGKTTAQMKQQATFAGWDFVNTWRIVNNITYPYLRSPADYGDFNCDGLVNRSDLDAFAPCLTGPAMPYDPTNPPPGCTLLGAAGILPADFDHDGDVDQSDFGIFQRCWSGTEPADPNCAN